MNIRDWWTLYSRIVEDFSFDPAMDYASSLMLSAILGERSSHGDSRKLEGKEVTIIGNGPEMKSLLGSISGSPVLVADSAIDSYYSVKGCPDYIVTDLDGNFQKTMECASRGTVLFVHAHGDNMDMIEKLSPQNGMKIHGTTQNIPLWNISNYGGFTDGDRAAYIADAFGAGRITLVGFDFNVPNPSKDSNPELKKKKLAWAKRLLVNLAELRGSEFAEGDFIEI